MYVLENRLKEIRLAQEKEQAEIAASAGVSRSTYIRYEAMLLGSTICVRFGHIKIRIDRTSMRIGGGKDEKLCDRTAISTTSFVHSVAEIY